MNPYATNPTTITHSFSPPSYHPMPRDISHLTLSSRGHLHREPMPLASKWGSRLSHTRTTWPPSPTPLLAAPLPSSRSTTPQPSPVWRAPWPLLRSIATPHIWLLLAALPQPRLVSRPKLVRKNKEKPIGSLIRQIFVLLPTVTCYHIFTQSWSCPSSTPPAADPGAVLKALYKALSLLQNNTIMTLGQPMVLPGAPMCYNGTFNGTACMMPTLLPGYSLQKIWMDHVEKY